MVVLREIRRHQLGDGNLIPREHTTRFMYKIVQDTYGGNHMTHQTPPPEEQSRRVSTIFKDALQCTIESIMVRMLQDANVLVLYSGRNTFMEKGV